MKRSSAKNGRELVRRLFALAEEFLDSAKRSNALGAKSSICYSMCFYAADRMLLAYLYGQGYFVDYADCEYQRTSELWAKCKELDTRFGALEQDFQLMLDCEWAGCPGEKTPDLTEVFGGAERLRSFTAQLTPCLVPSESDLTRGIEMKT